MNFFSQLQEWIHKLFGIVPVTTKKQGEQNADFVKSYEETDQPNFTAIFAGKLAALSVTESSIEISGTAENSAHTATSKRVELLTDIKNRVWAKSRKWTSLMLGSGGVLLVPYVTGSRIYVDIVSQDRMIINRVQGDEITALSILAEAITRGDKKYFRWTDYNLDGNVQIIRNKATTVSGNEIALSSVPEWSEITEELRITGVKHPLLAFIKSPIDNRKSEDLYGVPITYGCDAIIAEISECLSQIKQEFALKKTFVGLDSRMFEKKDGKTNLPKTGLFKSLVSGGLKDQTLWQIFDPAFRDSSYYNRLMQLFELLEKQVGTSRGILTKPESRGATATEIKAGLYDTYSIVALIRTSIEKGLDALMYACDVLINTYNLAPTADFTISYDWSYALIESSQETFTQLMTAVSVGAVEAAEIRQYIMPDETLEEAQAKVEDIRKRKKDENALLLEQALAASAAKNPNE